MAQLRLLADIVAFDISHVYLALDVQGSEDTDGAQLAAIPQKKQAILRFTLPECHVFLRALREFHGLIELTTPVLEEARRLNGQNGLHGHGGGDANGAQETSLDSIIERLTTRSGEIPPQSGI